MVFVSTIVCKIYISKEENKEKLYKEVSDIIQKEKFIENTDIYTAFLKDYHYVNEKFYYSFLELEGYSYPILLLSDDIYKYNKDQNVAMCTDIYYPVNNKLTLFGHICSNGTAYPLSANTSGIYTAGGHEVAKYTLDIQNNNLQQLYKYIIFFHKTDEKVNAITIAIINNENKLATQEEFDAAYKNYTNAKIIYFKLYNK